MTNKQGETKAPERDQRSGALAAAGRGDHSTQYTASFQRRIPYRFIAKQAGALLSVDGIPAVFTNRPLAQAWAEEKFKLGLYAIRNPRPAELADGFVLVRGRAQ
jgi:hypothetical protein